MKLKLIITAVSIFFLSNSKAMAQNSSATTVFPKGNKAESNFTGNVWLQPLLAQDSTFQVIAGSVTFEPGARTYWHSHPTGQILLITAGTGYTQERGKPIEVFHKGEVITCKPNVEHWHGASKNEGMSHISIIANTEKGVVTWLKPVTDDEYNGK